MRASESSHRARRLLFSPHIVLLVSDFVYQKSGVQGNSYSASTLSFPRTPPLDIKSNLYGIFPISTGLGSAAVVSCPVSGPRPLCNRPQRILQCWCIRQPYLDPMHRRFSDISYSRHGSSLFCGTTVAHCAARSGLECIQGPAPPKPGTGYCTTAKMGVFWSANSSGFSLYLVLCCCTLLLLMVGCRQMQCCAL